MSRLANGWWTLRRFGLTPDKLPARARRATRAAAPPVLVVSIPKAGTHLLERALCLHPSLYRKLVPTLKRQRIDTRWGGLEGLASSLRPGQVVVAHLRFTPGDPVILARHGVRTLFMIREPRDVLISLIHFEPRARRSRAGAGHTHHANLRDRLRIVVEGSPADAIPSIGDRLAYYRGWLDSGALVVRFEDLVGDAGGGDPRRQGETLRAIFQHIGIPADEDLVRSIQERVFSSASPTFRRGRIGQGREEFDAELDQAYRDSIGNLAAVYGYPPGPPAGP